MNTTDAAYAVVHDYPGGSESLGPRLSVSPAVLRNKVNPNNDTHRLALDEAVRISVAAGDGRILDAFAAEMGRITVDIPAAGVSDMDLVGDMTAMQIKVGQYMKVIHDALADRNLTKPELIAIRQQALETQKAVANLLACIDGMAEE